MVDTVRTKSALLASLFQDGQANGSITAQDMRDLIVTLFPAYMGIYVSSSSLTTISGIDTYTKVLGTTTVTNKTDDMDDDGGTSNRIRYTGSVPRHFIVKAQVSIQIAAGNNLDIALQFWKWDDSAGSGSYVAGSEIENTIENSDIIGTICACDVELDTNDYLELHVANKTDTNDLTISIAFIYAEGTVV